MKDEGSERSIWLALVGFVLAAGLSLLLGSIFFSSSSGVSLVVGAALGAATAVTLYHRAPDLTAWKPELLIGSCFGLFIAHLVAFGMLGADRLGSSFLLPSLVLVTALVAALSILILTRFSLDRWAFSGVVVAVSLFVAPLFLAVYADTILRPEDAIGYDPIWVFLVPPLAVVGTLAGVLFYVMYPGFRETAPADASNS